MSSLFSDVGCAGRKSGPEQTLILPGFTRWIRNASCDNSLYEFFKRNTSASHSNLVAASPLSLHHCRCILVAADSLSLHHHSRCIIKQVPIHEIDSFFGNSFVAYSTMDVSNEESSGMGMNDTGIGGLYCSSWYSNRMTSKLSWNEEEGGQNGLNEFIAIIGWNGTREEERDKVSNAGLGLLHADDDGKERVALMGNQFPGLLHADVADDDGLHADVYDEDGCRSGCIAGGRDFQA
ncbi:hypothetical protein LXL04_020858 [Taraxacum kok-saghyz]